MNKIINSGACIINFRDLKRGECFLYNNNVYMKIDEIGTPTLKGLRPYNSIRLSDGWSCFMLSMDVQKVDVTIYYKEDI